MSHLGWPEPTAEAQQSFDTDLAELGFVMNASRLWAYQPVLQQGIFSLLGEIVREYGVVLPRARHLGDGLRFGARRLVLFRCLGHQTRGCCG